MKAKRELLDKVIKCTQLGNQRGVSAIILGEQCGYPLGFIRGNSYKLEIDLEVLILNSGKDEGNKLGFTDFVYDHETGLIGVTTKPKPKAESKKKYTLLGHDGIADALQTPGATGSDERRAAIVGGRIAYLNGCYVSTEWSGHYGGLWTDSIVGDFQSAFFWSTKQPIHHIRWNAPVDEQKDLAKGPVKPAAGLLVSCGFFAINDTATRDGIGDAANFNKVISAEVASYLPKKEVAALNNEATKADIQDSTHLEKEISGVIASYLPKI